MIKIVTVAHVPEELAKAWLQHMRDFDTAHPGCHFQMAADAPSLSTAEVIELLRINPDFDFVAHWNKP